MPNISPLGYRFGLCHDRHGRAGVPYYATRDVLAGEELLVCYGAKFPRAYTTTCSNVELLSRWARQQERLLRPIAFP